MYLPQRVYKVIKQVKVGLWLTSKWWYNAMEWYGQQGMNSTATYDEWIWSNFRSWNDVVNTHAYDTYTTHNLKILVIVKVKYFPYLGKISLTGLIKTCHNISYIEC